MVSLVALLVSDDLGLGHDIVLLDRLLGLLKLLKLEYLPLHLLFLGHGSLLG